MTRKTKIIIDVAVVVVAIAVLAFFLSAPPETTARVPFDETHKRFFDIVAASGKKAAEPFCEECHHADGVPFPPNHPAKGRCLLCHKLEEGH